MWKIKEEALAAVEQDGELWFVASDVCKAINHSNPRMAIKGLDDDEKTTVNNPYAQAGVGAQTLKRENMTKEELIERINEAVYVAKILPGKDPRNLGARSLWPEIQQGKWGINYDSELKEVATLEQIKRMEEVFGWLRLLDYKQRRVILLRAMGWSWERIGRHTEFRVSYMTVQRRWTAAIDYLYDSVCKEREKECLKIFSYDV